MDDQALPSEILKRTSHITLYRKKSNVIVGASNSTRTLACVLTSTLHLPHSVDSLSDLIVV